MDFKKLSRITDGLVNGKVIVSDHSEREYKNPLDQLNKLHDSSVTPKVVVKKVKQIVICDQKFMREFAAATRTKKKEFLSRMSDSQRTRFLALKHKILDSAYSERIGYLLLDNLVYNYLVNPTNKNANDLQEFIETQEYCEFDEPVLSEVKSIIDGSTDTPNELIESTKRLIGYSSVESITSEPNEETFDEPTDEDLASMEDAAREIAVAFDVTHERQAVTDSVTEYLDKQKKNFDKVKLQSLMYSTILDSVNVSEYDFGEPIDDDKLDKLFEQSKSGEDKSVLDEFIEALKSYKEGNQEPLSKLVNSDVTEDTELEDITEEPEPSDSDEPSDTDESSEENEYLKDCVSRVAYGILHSKRANKPLKVLAKHVGSNITDAYLYTDDFNTEDINYEEVSGIPDIPLSLDEYNTLVKDRVPVPVIEKAMQKTYIPVIQTCEPKNGLVDINNGCLFYPIAGSAEEICKDSKNIEGKVVSLDVLLKEAAVQDCLPIISKGFYKKKLSSPAWSFDKERKPWCIPDSYKSTSVERVIKGQEDLFILGSPYKYV